ncbi:MAG: methyltransferase domain-containing protein [Pseudolysinimonas sp.]
MTDSKASKLRAMIANGFRQWLLIDPWRTLVGVTRYTFLQGRMKVLDKVSDGVHDIAIPHNISAFKGRGLAAFGMANRMKLLLYPVATIREQEGATGQVLIVGPRTEDDLLLARGLGMRNVRGLDLFSYSKHIELGDIHKTTYPDDAFEAVILGWVIAYSANPAALIKECKRIVRPGGLLGFGIESNIDIRLKPEARVGRPNPLNSAQDIVDLVKEEIVFIHDPQVDHSTSNAVVFRVA